MKNRTKLLLSITVIFLITIASILYFKNQRTSFVFVPSVNGGNKDTIARPPSHTKAKAVEPMAAFLSAFKSPITLHGKVVDQDGEPVTGAAVTLSPVDAPFSDDSRTSTVLTSDASGLFSIKGLRGFSMGVSVKKDGYLHLSPLGGPASSEMVSYGNGAEQGKRYSNPTTPLVLTLHKVGPLEPMVYVDSRRLRLPVDGTARRIALDTEKGLGDHQIEFRFKSDWNKLPKDNEINLKRYDWSFEARIPGGGFIWSDNDYNFKAPETGYTEIIRIEYRASMPMEQWKRAASGSFYVKFADGSHGRIRFYIDGSSDRTPLMLESWLNLKPGSRNLATPTMTPSAASGERYKKEWRW